MEMSRAKESYNIGAKGINLNGSAVPDDKLRKARKEIADARATTGEYLSTSFRAAHGGSTFIFEEGAAFLSGRPSSR